MKFWRPHRCSFPTVILNVTGSATGPVAAFGVPPNALPPNAQPWLTVRNAGKKDEPAEILIYGSIGKDPFDDSSVAADEFAARLKEIPKAQDILLRIHSPGGSVFDGLAIYHMLRERRERLTSQIDGIAISAASWIPLAAKRVMTPKNARWMIHDAAGLAFGNAKDMRELAERLDAESDNIADIYAEKTGRPKAEMRKMMKDTTWMTGQEAIDEGFADELVDFKVQNCYFDLSAFRHVPDDLRIAPAAPPQTNPTPTPTTQNAMNRKQLIALLNRHGIKFEDKATDDELVALLDKIPTTPAAPAPAPAPAPANVLPTPAPTPAPAPAPTPAPAPAAPAPELAEIRNELLTLRRERLLREIENTCPGIPPNDREAWVDRCLKDATLLNSLRSIPAQPVGADPINVQITSEDPKQIEKGILNLWGKGSHDPEEARRRGIARADIINKNLKRLIGYIVNAGTNTVATDLKRTVILQQMIRAFAIRVLPLSAFSTVFNGIRLLGTAKVAVPYFPLDTTASTDFVAANGYDTFGDTNADAKTVTVDKRKYQGLFWTSSELARQPFLNMGQSALLKAEQLGIDVVNNVLSVVTNANFGAAAHTGVAAAFDSNDVIDLKGVADLANWPAGGRSLMLNSTYDINLLKDSSVKSALNFGDDSPIRDGNIKRIVGFDYFPDSRVPANAENLQGFIVWKGSAILVAFSPIDPSPEVRSQLTRYEVVTHPETQATFEYRLWGDPNLDRSKEIIEANYGFITGEAAALKRIVSA